jgi:hypothetical protein
LLGRALNVDPQTLTLAVHEFVLAGRSAVDIRYLDRELAGSRRGTAIKGGDSW